MTWIFQPNLPVKRDNHILVHTNRMGMTTLPVLHRLFLPNKSINAVSQVVTRLVASGYLSRHELWHKSNYYTLGKKCVRTLGAPRSKTLSRGEQVLPTDLGALAFCCLQETVRRRLLPHELLAQYAWFPKQYLCHPFCVVTDGGVKRLAIIKVEMSEFPGKVLRKHMLQLRAFREFDGFAELIDDDQFMIITVTTTPERRDALFTEFDGDPWYPPFAVYDYPALCNLL